MMLWRYKLVTAPTAEPVTVADCRAQLRIVGTDEDALLTDLITVARQWAEEYLDRSLITQTWAAYGSGFGDGFAWLRHGPVQSITSVAYVDSAGDTQTWDSGNYQLDATTPTARLAPVEGVSWPSTALEDFDAATITYECGYGDAGSDVPAPIKQAILLTVSQFWWQRVPVAAAQMHEVPFTIRALLGPYRAELLR